MRHLIADFDAGPKSASRKFHQIGGENRSCGHRLVCSRIARCSGKLIVGKLGKLGDRRDVPYFLKEPFWKEPFWAETGERPVCPQVSPEAHIPIKKDTP